MRVAVATLGCKVNHYDTATIETRLRRVGVAIVPFAAGADVYVVNSCSVTDKADSESRQLARRARRLNPDARVIMTGCYAQTRPNESAIDEVDHVVGLNRIEDLLDVVVGPGGGERILVHDLREARRVETIGAEVFTGQTRAFLKVQEGCDLFCSFCIVPFARGKSRSVPPRQVLEQIEQLAAGGFKEVVLTGVHLGGYGHDLDAGIDLLGLLRMIAAHRPVARLRLSSIDPPEVTRELIEFVREEEIVCEHLHIPVQSGSDSVLLRMRRKYDSTALRALAEQLAKALPDATIGTDVIAGFPGETDAEFEATLQLLDGMPISSFHVFPYSPRSGTSAAKRTDHLPEAVIRERAQRLRELGSTKRQAFANRFIGRRLSVLIERNGARRPGWLAGYSRNYLRVEAQVGADAISREIDLRIVDQREDQLVGIPA